MRAALRLRLDRLTELAQRKAKPDNGPACNTEAELKAELAKVEAELISLGINNSDDEIKQMLEDDLISRGYTVANARALASMV